MANIRPLSKELQQKAIEELNEDDSRIPDDIQAIRKWLQQQKFINARTDDQTILTFLRGCKFSLERTKEKIETYYTMHTLLTDILKNRDPFQPEIQELLKLGAFLPILNQKDPSAPRVIISNQSLFDPDRVSKENFIKMELMVIDILLHEDDQCVISGLEFVTHFEGLKMAHIMTPALMLKTVRYIQDGIPSSTKGIYVINMPSFFESVFTLVKSFLNEKLKSRMQVYNSSNLDNLYKYISKEELPKEYGGKGPSLQELTDFWKKKVESYAEWFKESDQYGTVEKLRPGKPKTTQEFCGVEGVDGSFRKLVVD